MGRPLVHPRLLGRLRSSGFYADRATIRHNAVSRTSSGAEVLSPGALPGAVNIPAAVSPMIFVRQGEQRTSEGTTSEATHRIALQGAFPAITTRMSVEITGPHAGVYDVTRHDLDSQAAMTVLEARIVTPVAQAGV